MKKWLLCCCLLLALPLAVRAEDEKIDPANYICAEFVAQGAVSQDPPVFQALQIDGFVSSNIGYTVADPQAINVLVPQAYLMCRGGRDLGAPQEKAAPPRQRRMGGRRDQMPRL